jgi:hypothetical protein
MMGLKAAPEPPIRYTEAPNATDGSSLKDSGGANNEPFIIPKGTIFVVAYVEQSGVEAEAKFDIPWEEGKGPEVNSERPAPWKRLHRYTRYTMTKEAYAFLEKLKKFVVKVPGPTVTVAAGMYFVTGNLLADW